MAGHCEKVHEGVRGMGHCLLLVSRQLVAVKEDGGRTRATGKPGLAVLKRGPEAATCNTSIDSKYA